MTAKSAGSAAVLNFPIPGPRYIHNRHTAKGLVVVVVRAVSAVLTYVLTGFVFYRVVLVHAVFDAHRAARRVDPRAGRAAHAGRVG